LASPPESQPILLFTFTVWVRGVWADKLKVVSISKLGFRVLESLGWQKGWAPLYRFCFFSFTLGSAESSFCWSDAVVNIYING